ncbi:hypothetical protein GVN18_13790 [Pseudomonas sp. ODNR1LW]|nr:hypothetical protein [Pseudomonas sp. ODNR1LW]
MKAKNTLPLGHRVFSRTCHEPGRVEALVGVVTLMLITTDSVWKVQNGRYAMQ